MSNSALATYTKLSPHVRSRGGNSISKITVHHMAGNLSVEACGAVFSGSRVASAHYGIGCDGRIGRYADESQRTVTSSSVANDNVAVTIEVANVGGDPDWPVSDKAYSALIDLCVDICQRNGISALNYTGDATGNLTRHNMFAQTTCPGPYLQSRFPQIAEAVNKRLEDDDMAKITQDEFEEMYSRMIRKKTGNNPSDYAEAEAATAKAIKAGLFKGEGDGNYEWQDPITREQYAILADRLGILDEMIAASEG